jgi:hypothetical protein
MYVKKIVKLFSFCTKLPHVGVSFLYKQRALLLRTSLPAKIKYRNMKSNTLTVKKNATVFKILPRVWVTIDGVWIGNWIYCTLMNALCNSCEDMACCSSVQCTEQWNSSISETVRNRTHVHLHFLLRMTDTMTAQNIDLSSWDTLYTHRKGQRFLIFFNWYSGRWGPIGSTRHYGHQ